MRQVQGHSEQAARVLGFVEAWLQANQLNWVLFDRAMYERSVAAVRASPSASDFDVAWAAGQQLRLEQVIAEALEV